MRTAKASTSRAATARRSASRAARKWKITSAHREQFFALSADMLCIASGDGYFKWLNEPFSQTLGWTVDELLSRPYVEFIHPDDLDRTMREVERQVVAGETVFHFENRYRHKDGSWRVLSWTSVPRGKLMFATARDVTERNRLQDALQEANAKLKDVLKQRTSALGDRERENASMQKRLAQLQKMDALGQLTGGIAHDFNNILSVILGNADILSDALEDENHRGLAAMICKAAERGSELNNALLAFARRQPLEPKVVDANQLLVGMEKLLRRALGGQIELAFTHAASLWPVNVDPAQLESALLNLGINARDAMPEGGRLTFETAKATVDETYGAHYEDLAPGDYVLITVSDTGSGMTQEVLSRAFEPFFTTKAVGKGTGLGLSMVYGFVKQSGGNITVYSEVGHGTCFKIYLPRWRSEPLEAADTKAPTTQEPRGSETVLMVEDDPLVRAHVEGLLRGLGYRVVVASNGAEALERLQDHKEVDLLFTDVVMPGMGGPEVAARATTLRPALKVLFTSGYAENAIVNHGRLEPGLHLLRKPYRRRELALKLRELLDVGHPKAQRA